MLRVENISKSFSGVHALQDVSLQFDAGTVHVLCGENGAGKSTLMNIIAGNLAPDGGTIYWNGQPVALRTVQQAQQLGISIVHQERSLVDSLSIAENIFPQNGPKNGWGVIDYKTRYERANEMLTTIGMQRLSPKTPVKQLSAAQKSMIEIARVLATNPSLLILDEPTASLTQHETSILFNIIRQRKAAGAAVIYITHRMAEISEIADAVSVLKDGRYQGTRDAKTTSPESLVRLMVGRELGQMAYTDHTQPDIALEVENGSGTGFRDISFRLHKGEVLGFAGLEGSGRMAVARALFGDVPLHGVLKKFNLPITPRHPADAMRLGMAYLPDDRKTAGLFLDKSISENIASAQLQSGFYHVAKADATGMGFIKTLGIKARGVRQAVRRLSGGNQQKTVLAKWLATAPDVLIIAEPTHGVDVGAKAEVYGLLKKLTAEGKAIILVSSDLPELLLLSNRIAVFHGGCIRAIVPRNEATEERITALASGINATA